LAVVQGAALLLLLRLVVLVEVLVVERVVAQQAVLPLPVLFLPLVVAVVLLVHSVPVVAAVVDER
jgi:hypothetical protein